MGTRRRYSFEFLFFWINSVSINEIQTLEMDGFAIKNKLKHSLVCDSSFKLAAYAKLTHISILGKGTATLKNWVIYMYLSIFYIFFRLEILLTNLCTSQPKKKINENCRFWFAGSGWRQFRLPIEVVRLFLVHWTAPYIGIIGNAYCLRYTLKLCCHITTSNVLYWTFNQTWLCLYNLRVDRNSYLIQKTLRPLVQLSPSPNISTRKHEKNNSTK